MRRTTEPGLRQKGGRHSSNCARRHSHSRARPSAHRFLQSCGAESRRVLSDTPPSSGSRSARTLIKDVVTLSACSSIEHHRRRGKSAESLTIVGRFLQVGLHATWSTHASCSFFAIFSIERVKYVRVCPSSSIQFIYFAISPPAPRAPPRELEREVDVRHRWLQRCSAEPAEQHPCRCGRIAPACIGAHSRVPAPQGTYSLT